LLDEHLRRQRWHWGRHVRTGTERNTRPDGGLYAETGRYYTFPAVELNAEAIVNLNFSTTWNVAGSELRLGRATLVLQPTVNYAPTPSAPQMDAPGYDMQPRPGDEKLP